MLGASRFFFAMAAAAAAVGCGGDDAENPSGSGGSGGHGGAGAQASSSASTSSSSPTTSASTSSTAGGEPTGCQPKDGVLFAANKLYFGDSPAGAWQQYGFNIDGKVSSATSTDLCQPAAMGSAAKAYPDGNNGIDNSFGNNVLPLLLVASPTFPADANQSILDGNFTLMLKLDGLTSASDTSPLLAKLYGSAPLETPPKFDGNDCWPVAPELLSDPTDINSSSVLFEQGSLSSNVWDSGPNNTFIFSMPLGSTAIKLTVHAARVSLKLDENHRGATGGILGGVLDTEEFITEVKKIANAENQCVLIGQFEKLVRQSSDILNDGTQDIAKECNGISIGIGFDLKQVGFGGIGAETPPGTPCP